MEKTERLQDYLKSLSYEEVKALWACSDRIAQKNFQRLKEMDLYRNLTPALLSYEGIQYQYMAPEVFEDRQWEFVQEHLRILSGFYGVVRPLDGVVPYRLEMQTGICMPPYKNLYTYWGRDIYETVAEDAEWILNLASREYAKCIETCLDRNMPYVTCVFGEEKNGKIVQKGTLAKMARGEMVRFLSAEGITDMQGVKEFAGLGFTYQKELSTDEKFVFLREEKK